MRTLTGEHREKPIKPENVSEQTQVVAWEKAKSADDVHVKANYVFNGSH